MKRELVSLLSLLVFSSGCFAQQIDPALTGAVAPTGKVHTVEFREENALKAQKNLRRANLDKYWSYQIGDATGTMHQMLMESARHLDRIISLKDNRTMAEFALYMVSLAQYMGLSDRHVEYWAKVIRREHILDK